MQNSIISIGWDVGGWHGNNNGIVVINDKLELLDYQVIPRKENQPSNYAKRIKHYIEAYSPNKTIVCIDAPLSFPPAFVDFVLNQKSPEIFPEKNMIENPLAYRKAELDVFKDIKKKPLSPSFDYLTSNATLAISSVKHLTKSDSEFKCYPFDDKSSDDTKIILEVYPIAVDTVFKNLKGYQSYLTGLKFKDIAKNKIPHLHDAAICAWYGYHFLDNVQKLSPFTEEEKKNGKIFYR